MRLVTSSFSCGASREQVGERGRRLDEVLEVVEDEAGAASRRGSAPRLSATGTAPLSLSPSVCAIVGSTSAGSAIGASATKNTPCGKSSTSSAAAWSPSRVLPVPPGPVSVSRRTSSRRSCSTTAATSRSRPISGVGWTGRFVGRFSSVRNGGNSLGSPSITSCESRCGRVQVLEPVLAEVAQRDPVGQLVLDELARRLRDQHLPAVASRADPRRARHVEPDVPRRPDRRLAGVDPDPDRAAASPPSRAAPARPPGSPRPRSGTRRRTRRPACRPHGRPPPRTPRAAAGGARRAAPRTRRDRDARAAPSSPRRR